MADCFDDTDMPVEDIDGSIVNKESDDDEDFSLTLKKKADLWSFDNNDHISHFMNGLVIFSTSRGLLTHIEAYKNSVGGEVLFKVS